MQGRWGTQKLRSQPVSWSTACCNAATARCYQHDAAGPWQVVTLIDGSKRRNLLMAWDDDEMFTARSLNVTPKTTEQYLIVFSDKSVTYVTNNKRLCSTICTIEANDWQTRSIARPLTAELLVGYPEMHSVTAIDGCCAGHLSYEIF